MPVWLQIIIAIFGLVGTILGIFGISAYINERMKHKAAKQNQKEDEAEQEALEKEKKLAEMKHQEYKNELTAIIRAEFAPIIQDLVDIKNDLKLVKNGLQKDLYVDLAHIYDEYKRKGYASLSEKRDYDTLYWAYHNLGKNGVADNMHEYVMNMPESKPRRKRTTKKVLLENKERKEI